MRGYKILITGPTGQVATPIATALAADNEVWGVARFNNPQARQDLEQAGGLLVLVSARYNGKITFGVVGYQVGAQNTKAELRERVQQTFDELGVTPLVARSSAMASVISEMRSALAGSTVMLVACCR